MRGGVVGLELERLAEIGQRRLKLLQLSFRLPPAEDVVGGLMPTP